MSSGEIDIEEDVEETAAREVGEATFDVDGVRMLGEEGEPEDKEDERGSFSDRDAGEDDDFWEEEEGFPPKNCRSLSTFTFFFSFCLDTDCIYLWTAGEVLCTVDLLDTEAEGRFN